MQTVLISVNNCSRISSVHRSSWKPLLFSDDVTVAHDTLNVLSTGRFGCSAPSPHAEVMRLNWGVTLRIKISSELLVCQFHREIHNHRWVTCGSFTTNRQYQITHCDGKFSDSWVILSPCWIFNAVRCRLCFQSVTFPSGLSGFQGKWIGPLVPQNVRFTLAARLSSVMYCECVLTADVFELLPPRCDAAVYCTSAQINTVTAYCARFPELNY